jgi:hypothetical protein
VHRHTKAIITNRELAELYKTSDLAADVKRRILKHVIKVDQRREVRKLLVVSQKAEETWEDPD